MTRFNLKDLVDLGGGWWRHQVPGEELYRLRAHDGWVTPWFEERRLGETEAGEAQLAIESMVVPGPPPADAPDPRQLALPLVAPGPEGP